MLGTHPAWKAEFLPQQNEPGSRDAVVVMLVSVECGGCCLVSLQLQTPGKRPLRGRDFRVGGMGRRAEHCASLCLAVQYPDPSTPDRSNRLRFMMPKRRAE